jgi:hypothetical protein
MTLQRRLRRLEERVPPPDAEEELRHQRWLKVVDRFFRLVEPATERLSPR